MQYLKSKSALVASVFSVMLLFACYTSHSGETATIKPDQGKNEILMRVVMQGLNSAHFQPEKIDDAFSKKVFDLALTRLDYNKKFLHQSDVDKLRKFETKIDDQVKAGSYEFLNLSTRLFAARVKENKELYDDILAKPFDFTIEESLEIDPEKQVYPKDRAAHREALRKYLKYQTMIQMVELIEMQDKAQESKEEKKPVKSIAELEVEARAKIAKSGDEMFRRISQLGREDSVAAFINAIANAYDPHTEFYPPKDKASFDIAMTGRLEGIGATLSERDGQIKVTEIVPGSASYRQGELKAGDIIMKVGQGKEAPVSIEGMRLDNAVLLVRGKKGTEVRLTVKKPDGLIKVISIIRDIVIIEETYAQSVLINAEKPVGYIKLPGFYADFDNKGGRNSAEDIRREIEKLKKNNIQGLILDLRNNGGGSLQEAVTMTGLFIDKGPVVQVQTSGSAPTILEDRDSQVQYNGPLVILVNQFSASASEIVAAAIQDYKRGVIVGTAPTFGKGTVQQVFNLDNVLPSEFNGIKPIGSLKLTTQKFYRANGGATQLRGVTPDILLPDLYTYLEQGEKDMEYALPWDEIKPARIDPWDNQPNMSKLKINANSRINNNASFRMITDLAQKMKKQADMTNRSLKLDTYLAESKKSKADAKKYEDLVNNSPKMNIISLKTDLDKIGADTVKQNIASSFVKNLKKDIYLTEATNIIQDQWQTVGKVTGK